MYKVKGLLCSMTTGFQKERSDLITIRTGIEYLFPTENENGSSSEQCTYFIPASENHLY